MKLLLYSHDWAPTIGGVQTITRLLADGLANRPVSDSDSNEPTEVTLRVLRLVRPSGDAATDKRTLGVALEWIRAAPAEG